MVKISKDMLINDILAVDAGNAAILMAAGMHCIGCLAAAGVYEFDEARRSADMLLMKADFNKENTELTLTLTTPDYMSKETAEKLKPFLRRPVVYHWKNGAFSI